MTIRLDQQLAEHARSRPQSIALQWNASSAKGAASAFTMSYAQLHAAIDHACEHLSQRYEPGSVIMLRSPNEAAYVTIFLAILRAGFKVFPVNPQFGALELLAAARRTDAVALISNDVVFSEETDFDQISIAQFTDRDLLAVSTSHSNSSQSEIPNPKSEILLSLSPGLLLQSSGTTGLPKIVFRDRPSLDAVAENVAHVAGLQVTDRILAIVHLSHSYGIENAMLGPLWAGSTIHLLRSADATSLPDVLAGEKITVLPAVPFLFELLAQSAANRSGKMALRLAYSAGSPLPPQVFAACEKYLGLRVGQLYGATEVGSVTFNNPTENDFDPASVGSPMGETRIQILDPEHPDADKPLPMGMEGHVAIQAPSMFQGYVDGPNEIIGNGFFLTGDLGKLDDRGRLTITGRLKLLIDVGGIKVNPMEVEQILNQHPQVKECVVVPLPITQTIDRLKAIVVLRDHSATFVPDDLRRFAGQRLSAYKVPRVVEVVPSLPRSSTGKILRQKVES